MKRGISFQTNDLRTVHRGTKFSCRFTVQELQQRWYALLYDPAVSRVAVAAMRNLHPELIASVQSRALYSKAEEQLLGTIKSVSVLVSRLSRQCGNLNISQPYEASKACYGDSFTFFFTFKQAGTEA
jgi:microspherule protein 1